MGTITWLDEFQLVSIVSKDFCGSNLTTAPLPCSSCGTLVGLPERQGVGYHMTNRKRTCNDKTPVSLEFIEASKYEQDAIGLSRPSRINQSGMTRHND